MINVSLFIRVALCERIDLIKKFVLEVKGRWVSIMSAKSVVELSYRLMYFTEKGKIYSGSFMPFYPS